MTNFCMYEVFLQHLNGRILRSNTFKTASRHCAAAFSLQVPKSCTYLDPTLLYISTLGKHPIWKKTFFQNSGWAGSTSFFSTVGLSRLNPILFAEPDFVQKSLFFLFRVEPAQSVFFLSWARELPKKKNGFWWTFRIDCGWLWVAHGGCGAQLKKKTGFLVDFV